MKRSYAAPTVEKIEFRYNEQIVAQSTDPNCGLIFINTNIDTVGSTSCCFWQEINRTN